MLRASGLFTPTMRDMGESPPTNAVRLVPIAVLDEGEGPSLSTLPRTAVLPLLGERARLRQEPIEHFGLFILNILGSNFDFPTLSLFRASKMPLTVRAAPQGRLSFFFLLQDLGLGWPRGGRWRAAPDGPSPPSLQKPPRGGGCRRRGRDRGRRLMEICRANTAAAE